LEVPARFYVQGISLLFIQPNLNIFIQGSAETNIAKRISEPMWSREMGTQLLVWCKNLQFGLGSFEPFFCTLALYDLSAGVRLSEDFHFDLNDPEVLQGSLTVWRYSADKVMTKPNHISNLTPPPP